MGNSYYSHGILIVPVSVFLAIQRFRHDPQLHRKRFTGSNYGFILTGVSLAAYLYFVNEKAQYLAAVAMIGLIAGLVWTLAGTVVLKKMAFPIAFLLFMVPMPFVERLTYPLSALHRSLFYGYCKFPRLTANGSRQRGNAAKQRARDRRSVQWDQLADFVDGAGVTDRLPIGWTHLGAHCVGNSSDTIGALRQHFTRSVTIIRGALVWSGCSIHLLS